MSMQADRPPQFMDKRSDIQGLRVRTMIDRGDTESEVPYSHPADRKLVSGSSFHAVLFHAAFSDLKLEKKKNLKVYLRTVMLALTIFHWQS